MPDETNEIEVVRQQLEEKYGAVWNTKEVQQDFTVLSFLAPYVIVVRKSDGAKGRLEFQHSPRFYFNFIAS
jgi:hypothetical protein